MSELTNLYPTVIYCRLSSDFANIVLRLSYSIDVFSVVILYVGHNFVINWHIHKLVKIMVRTKCDTLYSCLLSTVDARWC